MRLGMGKAPGSYAGNYWNFNSGSWVAGNLTEYSAKFIAGSWDSIVTKTGFTTAILNIAGYQVGNVIHLLVQDGTMSSSVATEVSVVRCGHRHVLRQNRCRRLRRSRDRHRLGVALVVPTATSSRSTTACRPRPPARFARVYYRERTGNTYGTETQVDANTAVDNTKPLAV